MGGTGMDAVSGGLAPALPPARLGRFSCWLMLGTWMGTVIGLLALGAVVVWTCIQIATAHGGVSSEYLFLGADVRVVFTGAVCAAVPGGIGGAVMGLLCYLIDARANRTLVALLLGAGIGFEYGGWLHLPFAGLICGVLAAGTCARLMEKRERLARIEVSPPSQGGPLPGRPPGREQPLLQRRPGPPGPVRFAAHRILTIRSGARTWC